jgi:hypothetical protein
MNRLTRPGNHPARTADCRWPADIVLAVLAAVALTLATSVSLAADAAPASLSCELKFTMKGWSAIYNTATGAGTATCSDGTTMRVKLRSKGAGLTAGKVTIDVGKGTFKGLTDPKDIPGAYLAVDASAGAVKSGTLAVLARGGILLTLTGTGHGWDAGISMSDFTIERF